MPLQTDYHVEFDRRFYSVPYQLVRQKVEVWATATTIEIYHCHRRVASHVREYGRRRYITDPAHMPASHRATWSERPRGSSSGREPSARRRPR